MKKLSEVKEEVVDDTFGLPSPKREKFLDKVSFFFASRLVLKPCPFCGNSHPMLYTERLTHQPSNFYPEGGTNYVVEIGCTQCRSKITHCDEEYEETFVGAITKWQTRAGIDENPRGAFGQSLWNHIHDPNTPILL